MANASVKMFFLSLSCLLFVSCKGQGSTTIRLVGGTTQYEGRVEVYHNGQWQTVCDDSWGISEAQVVCRQLGYGSAVSALSRAYFGRGSGAQWEVNWYCSGSESSLQSCRTSSASCSHSEDASVRCSGSVGSSTIRLVGGTSQYEGRVEVYRSGQWQTVCDDSWGISEAQVVCRQLGYGSAVSALRNAYFGRGSGAQWDVYWYCSGSESSLQSCRTRSSGCSHSEDASVRCSGSSDSSTIRLVGGTTQYEGRVEVYRNGQWQTVCDDSWGISEAQVVCRQLGYGSAVSALSRAYFGRGSGAQWEVNWYCSGSESSLQSCRTSSSSCGHSEDASVRCSAGSSVGAITGGAVGGVIAGGLCICLALCICVSVCCCYQKKKAQRRTAASVPTATVQPAAVAIVGQTTAQDGQQSNKPPEYMYNPGYNPTLQGGYTLYPVTYTQPSPYPLVPGGTLPPTYPPAGGTLPPAYPTAGGGTLPPAYPAPGGTLPTGFPPQQPYPAQPPDMPPPYPVAPTVSAPQ